MGDLAMRVSRFYVVCIRKFQGLACLIKLKLKTLKYLKMKMR